LGQPDIRHANDINNLAHICRKCRFFHGGERSREIWGHCSTIIGIPRRTLSLIQKPELLPEFPFEILNPSRTPGVRLFGG